MIYQVQIPSKTFLVGEYSVLSGGVALIATSQPEFITRATRGEGLAKGFHRESPAGLYMREHRMLFADFDLEFLDPHDTRGGFGASSAQFLSVWLLKSVIEQQSWRVLEDPRFYLKTWSDFKSILKGQNDRSSGADLLAQAVGQMVAISMQPIEAHSLIWPFLQYGFALIRTGVKVKTYEHLKDIDPVELKHDFRLTKFSRDAINAFKAGDWSGWIESQKQFSQVLEDLDLVAGPTLHLLSMLSGCPQIIFAKGCGSLGADTIVVYFKEPHQESVVHYVEQMGLDVVATHRQTGMRVTVGAQS